MTPNATHEATHAYIGRKPCGCVVAATVDNPEHVRDTAREVGKWVRQGMTVERVLVEVARGVLQRCRCNEKAKP